MESSYKNTDVNIIIIDNGGSKSTGGHKLSASIDSILKNENLIESNFNSLDTRKINNILSELINTNGTNIWLIHDIGE